MSGWTLDMGRAFERAVVAPRVSLIVRPGDPAHALLSLAPRAFVGALPAALRPIVGSALTPLEDLADRVSVTVPVPLALPVIVLSPRAVADPVTESCTTLHELTHAYQIEAAGRSQSVADYVSGELRAQREADGAAASLWLRWVITGEAPYYTRLSDIYCLTVEDAGLAGAIMTSHTEAIRAGLVPNIKSCVAAARWLRDEPNIPAEIRARVPALPEVSP